MADIPQSDDLRTVRTVVEALCAVGPRVAEIAEETGYSERHVRYRLQSARVLGLIDGSRAATRLGVSLLRTDTGSSQELRVLVESASKSPSLQVVVPDLLGPNVPDVESLALRIASLTGSSKHSLRVFLPCPSLPSSPGRRR